MLYQQKWYLELVFLALWDLNSQILQEVEVEHMKESLRAQRKML